MAYQGLGNFEKAIDYAKKTLLLDPKFTQADILISQSIKYKSENHEISQFLSKNSDGRVIWGGDKSIFNIKKYETKVDNIDLVFKDKYSFCIIT